MLRLSVTNNLNVTVEVDLQFDYDTKNEFIKANEAEDFPYPYLSTLYIISASVLGKLYTLPTI